MAPAPGPRRPSPGSGRASRARTRGPPGTARGRGRARRRGPRAGASARRGRSGDPTAGRGRRAPGAAAPDPARRPPASGRRSGSRRGSRRPGPRRASRGGSSGRRCRRGRWSRARRRSPPRPPRRARRATWRSRTFGASGAWRRRRGPMDREPVAAFAAPRARRTIEGVASTLHREHLRPLVRRRVPGPRLRTMPGRSAGSAGLRSRSGWDATPCRMGLAVTGQDHGASTSGSGKALTRGPNTCTGTAPSHWRDRPATERPERGARCLERVTAPSSPCC